MRDTVVQQVGEYPHTVDVDESQKMVFDSSHEGPFWLSPEERLAKKEDRPTGVKKKRKFKKKELIQHLKDEKGITVSGTLSQIQATATRNNLPLEYEYEVIEEGWMNKPKGMLQVLWERGYIDASKGKGWYTVDGRRDEYGNRMEETSLKLKMELQQDFIEEETLLQYHGRLLNVIIDRTPKCHPEMAGEGIEYSWGMAKLLYRKLPTKEKKSKEKFINSVRECISRTNIDTHR